MASKSTCLKLKARQANPLWFRLIPIQEKYKLFDGMNSSRRFFKRFIMNYISNQHRWASCWPVEFCRQYLQMILKFTLMLI